MTRNILIADSGNTKTEWVLLQGSDTILRTMTQGINPFMLDEAEIESILDKELLPQLNETSPIDDIYFYGAGCRGKMIGVVCEAPRHVLDVRERVEVESDLLGAARAVCGHTNGLAYLLSTGSNSCLFTDGEIKDNISPLGFILSDEGSGAKVCGGLENPSFWVQIASHIGARASSPRELMFTHKDTNSKQEQRCVNLCSIWIENNSHLFQVLP